ncbi:MAG: hypothetical protein ACTHMC_03735 [Pseudobacter sp.]|uniref:hypothetical protein n=1 Tax=Pseudobacter sp. TaxID=2045420 RepID=UPI003F801814
MEFIKNKLLLFVLSCFSLLKLSAQNKAIIPTTPEAAAFTKVVNVPVNLNSGLPNISVPVWNLEVGGLSLPVSLDYHAGGFRINEKSGRLGLGWNLSTDIQITRNINGQDDFGGTLGYGGVSKIRPHSINGIDNPPVFTNNELYYMANGERDGKPDKFSFRLLNKSGSFYMVRNIDGNGYYFVPAPFENLKITYSNNQFRIVDTDGTVYLFGTTAPVVNWEDLGSTAREYSSDAQGLFLTTTWKCIRIINAASTETLEFNYVTKAETKSLFQPDYVTFYNDENQCQGHPAFIMYPYLFPNSTAISSQTTMNGLLGVAAFFRLGSPKYIEYAHGFSKFFKMIWKNPATNQMEVKSYDATWDAWPGRRSANTIRGVTLSSITWRGGSIEFTGVEQLTAITIRAGGQEVKTANLHQTLTSTPNISTARVYNGTGFNGTLYLDSVRFSVNGTPYERYGFLYKNKTCFGDHLKGSDAWGYTNTRTMEIATASVIQAWHFPVIEFNQMYSPPSCTSPENITVKIDGYGDEYPDEELMQNGMLTRMLYPTGGYVDFDYEANRFESRTFDELGEAKRSLFGGGLRISKINFYDGIKNLPVKQKYYTYGETENGDGQLLNPPPIQFVNGKMLFGNYKFTQDIYYGFASVPMSGGPGNDDFPPLVTSACYASSCVELIKKETKTTILPCSALGFEYGSGSSIYYTKVTEYEMDYGKQSGRTVYNYYPVNEFNTTMASQPLQTMIRNNTDEKMLQETWFYGKPKSVEQYAMVDGKYYLRNRKSYQYTPYYFPYAPSVHYSYLANLYSVGGVSSTGKPSNLYIDDKGGLIGNIRPVYSDFNTGYGFIPLGALRLTKEEEEVVDENNNLLKTTTDYMYNNDRMLPSLIQTSNSKNEVFRKTIKYAYDYPGDLTYIEMNEKNMISQVIEEIVVKGAMPGPQVELTRVKNNYAKFNNNFYALSSKQSSTKGGQLVTDITFKEYDSFGNLLEVIDRSGIRKSYVWGYSNRFPVAEVTGATQTQIQAAGLLQTVLNSPLSNAALFTELNKLNSLSGGLIQRTKYAYKPFVGISEATNVNDLHTKYEYDQFNRLTTIYDNNNHILKQMEYSNLITSSDYFTSRGYVNRPVMLTQGYCKPLPPMAPYTPANNHYILGGTHIGLTQKSIDTYVTNLLLSTLGSGHTMAECFNTPNWPVGGIRLVTTMDIPPKPKPERIKVDILQGGSVAGSLRYGLTDTEQNHGYFFEGTYQLGISYDPIYRGRTVKFYVSSSDGQPGFWAYNGTIIEIKKGVMYTINATTNM